MSEIILQSLRFTSQERYDAQEFALITCKKEFHNVISPSPQREDHVYSVKWKTLDILFEADTASLSPILILPHPEEGCDKIIDKIVQKKRGMFRKVILHDTDLVSKFMNSYEYHICGNLSSKPLTLPDWTEKLYLSGSKLLNFPPTLKSLSLHWVPLEKEDMIAIGSLKRLEELNLEGDSITFYGLPVSLRILKISEIKRVDFSPNYEYECPYLFKLEIDLSTLQYPFPIDSASETVVDLSIHRSDMAPKFIQEFRNLINLKIYGRNLDLSTIVPSIRNLNIASSNCLIPEETSFDNLTELSIRSNIIEGILKKTRNLEVLHLDCMNSPPKIKGTYPSIKKLNLRFSDSNIPVNFNRGKETFPNLEKYESHNVRSGVREIAYPLERELNVEVNSDYSDFDYRYVIFEKFLFKHQSQNKAKTGETFLPLWTKSLTIVIDNRHYTKTIEEIRNACGITKPLTKFKFICNRKLIIVRIECEGFGANYYFPIE